MPTTFLKKVRWWVTWSIFVGLHVACLLVFVVPLTWTAAILGVVLYVTRAITLTAGFHRYFAHRSFKTTRAFQFVLGWVGTTLVQGSPAWWAANHRRHHLHSDTDEDPHSPIARSAWWSYVGWILAQDARAMDWNRVKDWARYPELRWLERWESVPPVLLAGACYLIAGWSGVVWGFLVSTVAVYHITFLLNCVCHLFGSRRFATADHSRNNWWVALLTFGEGWHNNHHHYPSSARAGFRWWEFDPTYYTLRVLSWVGIVWDLRQPTPRSLTVRRAKSPEDLRADEPATTPDTRGG